MARVLILGPELVVADEPVSMADVPVRACALNVFREVRDRLGFTAIHISYDLSLVRYVCERTIVMHLGRVMEDGPTEETSCTSRCTPNKKALVAAVPAIGRPPDDRRRGLSPSFPASFGKGRVAAGEVAGDRASGIILGKRRFCGLADRLGLPAAWMKPAA